MSDLCFLLCGYTGGVEQWMRAGNWAPDSHRDLRVRRGGASMLASNFILCASLAAGVDALRLCAMLFLSTLCSAYALAVRMISRGGWFYYRRHCLNAEPLLLPFRQGCVLCPVQASTRRRMYLCYVASFEINEINRETQIAHTEFETFGLASTPYPPYSEA